MVFLLSMKTHIKITGMHCASCKALLEDVARDVPGVISCMIDPKRGIGTIEHDASFTFDTLAKEVAALDGYAIEKM